MSGLVMLRLAEQTLDAICRAVRSKECTARGKASIMLSDRPAVPSSAFCVWQQQ